MIDIHNHLLFGVDDGSEDLEESLTMVRQYMGAGFTGAIVTPHYDKERYLVDRDLALAKKAALEEALRQKGLDFALYLGNEIYLDEKSIGNIKDRTVSTMAGSHYVLVEFPFRGTPLYAENLLYELRLEGYIPIIAHGERYEFTKKNFDFFTKLVNDGSFVQMNYHSLDEKSPHRDMALKLLDLGVVSFLATDAHGKLGRSPEVSSYIQSLKARYGEDRINEILDNPRYILEDRLFPFKKIEEVERVEKKKGFFGRLFGGRN